ncbi:hypothetical protein F511_45046 [Dorcoceras hygrometricum]|uniref:Uncharacterized protein n=1 Tax=Dorcoceras hygrometricum TaxID=472368 RepID=A0A2Z6ZX32_9LAMI|nr:hypothetical protein F511_45046 [Dorcoceras hygrometricum]
MKLSAKDDATSYWRSAEEAKRKDEATSYEEASSYCSSAASYSAISRCYLELAIAKQCRLHKLIRQRFAIAIKIQQEDFALLFQQTKLQCPVATQRYPVAKQSAVVVKSSRKLCISSRLGVHAQEEKKQAK